MWSYGTHRLEPVRTEMFIILANVWFRLVWRALIAQSFPEIIQHPLIRLGALNSAQLHSLS